MIEIISEEKTPLTVCGVKLKIIGIGGAGGNAVNSMISSADMNHAEFIVANTDAQALSLSPSHKKIQLGKKLTKGLGAGSNPDVGRRAAEEDLDTILEHIENTDILFLTAGLGGGTGSGALPVIANVAKELGVLTVAVITKPFDFEGKRRKNNAEDTLKKLKDIIDTLIIVPNQRLLETSDPDISLLNAFSLSNDILKQGIKGISDIITQAGHINVDFADVKTIMKNTGMAIMGTGKASGPERARQATTHAITSPLLEEVSINNAKGILINITGSENLGLHEINEAASVVYDKVNSDANIILGSVIDSSMEDEISVTIIATGLENCIRQENIVVASVAPRKDYTTSNPIKGIISIETISTTEDEKKGLEKTTLDKEIKTQDSSIKKEDLSPLSCATQENFDMNDLDTPTFLRKKAEEESETPSKT